MQELLIEKSEKLEAAATQALHELETKEGELKRLADENEQQKKELETVRAEAAALREQSQRQTEAVREESKKQMDALREENKAMLQMRTELAVLRDEVKSITELRQQLTRLQAENGRLKTVMRGMETAGAKLRDEVNRMVGQMSQELAAI